MVAALGRGVSRRLVIVLAIVGLVSVAGGAPAIAAGRIDLASHVPDDQRTTAAGLSASGVPSADGRFVAFVSNAANLVAGQSDANGDLDVFLLERATGVVSLVSHVPGSPTVTSNGISSFAALSADGAFVAFTSTATNLVPGQSDANDSSDVFLYERAGGTVRLVSHAAGSPAQTAEGFSGSPSISGDGRLVAFHSTAANLAPGQSDSNRTFDAFLFDRTTDEVALISHRVANPTTAAGGGAGAPTISASGGFVVFPSFSTDLVAGQADGNGTFDVFLFEVATGLVTLVSRAAGTSTTAANGFSWAPAISADGRAVAFQSDATNLVPGQSDAPGKLDVFLFEPPTGTMTLVSHAATGPTTAADHGGGVPAISADGRTVAFASVSTNLVTGQVDPNGDFDVFVYERATGLVTLASHRPDSAVTTGNAFSAGPRIDDGGTVVVFDSDANDLAAGQNDTNTTTDVFLWSRSGPSRAPGDFDGDGYTDVAVFRPSSGTWFVQGGPTLAWGTSGDVPVPGDYDGDGDTDIAVFRPSTGTWFVQGGPTVNWGTNGDVPVPGDYDGDGDTDIAVFRPSTGTWFVRGGPTVNWGTSGDIPVPGDYDGDGDTDVAVFRPSSGTWFVQGGPVVAWGTSGDQPLPQSTAVLTV